MFVLIYVANISKIFQLCNYLIIKFINNKLIITDDLKK